MTDNSEILSPDESRILKHMLGVSSRVPPEDWGYRNFFCAEVDYVPEALLSLERRGFVFRGRMINDASDVYFHATMKGKEAVGALGAH